MSEAKLKFALWCVNQRGRPVLWGAKGPGIFDCSGLVSCGILAQGGPDHRQTWNAQHYADSLDPAAIVPEPGDLGFYGTSWQGINHVVIALLGAHLVSADGASRAVVNLQEALTRKCAVHLHETKDYRHDEPFMGWRRNTLLG